MKVQLEKTRTLGLALALGLIFMGVSPEANAQDAKFKIEKTVEKETDGKKTTEVGKLIVTKIENGKETVYEKNLDEIDNEEKYLESLGVDLKKLKTAKKTKKIHKQTEDTDKDGVTVDVQIKSENGVTKKTVTKKDKDGKVISEEEFEWTGDEEPSHHGEKMMIKGTEKGDQVEVKVEVKDGKTVKTIIIKDKDGKVKSEKELIMDGESNGKQRMMIIDEAGDGENVFILNDDNKGNGDEKQVRVEIKSENGKTVKTTTVMDKDGNVVSKDIEEVPEGAEMSWSTDGGDSWNSKEAGEGTRVRVVTKGDGKHKIIHLEDEENENGKRKMVTRIIKIKIEDPSKEEVNKVDDASFSNFTDNNLKMDRFELFPNPNNGKFNVNFDLKKKGDTEIRVVDVKGREMYFETLKNFKGNYSNEIELGEVAKGIYFLQVSQNGKQMVKKIITE